MLNSPGAVMPKVKEAKLYTDGGSRGNPGESACAYVIYGMNDVVLEKAGLYLGLATNNQAEYSGLQRGLERARELGIEKISLFSDSQLVVNQMNNLYRVKNRELIPLHQEVKNLATFFKEVTFNYVPRELNKIADSEVNRILDEQESSGKRALKSQLPLV
ncbi:MAG: ribonuclease HI family protein [Candidatus Saccharimonadales bacterium]